MLYLASAQRGKPKQIYLRRAYSTLYYSLFHCLTNCCADLLAGKRGKSTSRHAWLQLYRSLEHGYAKAQCENNQIVSKFPAPIATFATVFAQVQAKRHKADYDPYEKFYKSQLLNDMFLVQDTITAFKTCSRKDRTAFSIWVAVKSKPR